jgi:hypothetical protein
VWKILERQTLTTSRTLKAYFKKAREGTIKGLAVKSFYSGEEFYKKKRSIFPRFFELAMLKFSLYIFFLYVSYHQISCIVSQTGRFGSKQFFL